MPKTACVSRENYKKIRTQFLTALKQRKQNTTSATPILAIVTMRGVPFHIQDQSIIIKGKKTPTLRDEAAFDSEIGLCKLKHDIKFAVRNPYFKAKQARKDFVKNYKKGLNFPILVSRIDGPSYTQCKQLILDSLAVEQTGLWGMCYLDLSGKYKRGDNWLKNIETLNWEKAIPTVTDKNRHCYNSHYPMENAALYFGWYASQKNGPLRDSRFRFKKGAIATHIHSFSGVNIRSNKNWVGPLLNAGACVVTGHTSEPYLEYSTYLDIYHQRLLQGYSVLEAYSMAIPVLSWQNILIADPLYRPFKHFEQVHGVEQPADSVYRILRIVKKLGKKKEQSFLQSLQEFAKQQQSSSIYESLGLLQEYKKNPQAALQYYQLAYKKTENLPTKVRLILHQANLLYRNKQKQQAVQLLKKAITLYKGKTNITSLISQRDYFAPPPPPRLTK